jgi:protease-4
MHNIFVRQVAENRGMTIDEVKILADGSSMIAGRAKEAGLIDEIGSIYNAMDYLSGVIKSKAEVCELE